MYQQLLQSSDRPFRATPDARFYFAFDSMEQTRQTVLRVVRRAEGPAAVMAGVGLGKSLLAQVLSLDFADRFDVVRLHAARLCSRRAMLQNILFELQLPYRDLSEGELRLSLMERMEPSPAHAPDGIVIIVDEAQTLPTKLLEELRLITNFARQGQARARMVLLGSMHLEETFALPEMSSFNQRLAARCFLQPMNREQTAEFVRHQFRCVNIDPKQIITRDALENVYIASEGIPRLANQVMDHALILAIANDQYPISAALIQEAWADLQQLPMSWNSSEPVSAQPVEFGTFEDLDQDFELDPENSDDLEVMRAQTTQWPTSSDLDDFGPTASSYQSPTFTSASKPSSVDCSESNSSDSVRFNASTSASGSDNRRMVFDASTLFQDLKPTTPNVNSMNAGSSGASMMNSTSSSPSLSVPKLHVENDSDYDMLVLRDIEEPVALSLDKANVFSRWPTETRISQPANETSIRFHSEAYPSQPIPMPVNRIEPQTMADPFGQDFDEEFVVDAQDVRRWQERERMQKAQSMATSKPSIPMHNTTTPACLPVA